ncbi:MAG: GIY-YIG nuclease family protein [bacterium]
MYCIYIITNKYNDVFYVGMTNNLARRVFEHKEKLIKGFSNKYNLNKLVYYEVADNPETAIFREKQIKNWHREWKINQINKTN